MARKSRYKAENAADEPELQIAPLIDVSFLLLIYFLVTSTMQPREGDLDVTFPTTDLSPDTQVKIDPLTVEVTKDGAVRAGVVGNSLEELDPPSEHSELPGLLAKLSDYKQIADLSGQQTFVVIKADDEAKQQRFIDVINTLTEVELDNVTLTGFKPDE